MSQIKNLSKFKKVIILVSLLTVIGIGAWIVFAAVSVVAITAPTNASPHYVQPGATETVTFSVTFDTLDASKLRVEIYRSYNHR